VISSSNFRLILLIMGLSLMGLAVYSMGKHPPAPATEISENEHLVMATLWYQRSAEARALYYQAYNLARLRLQQDLQNKTVTKPRAIIVDIDETVLNNSPYEARLILQGGHFPQYWTEWVNQAQAKALPGALPFLRYADSMGVAIFYVTNRHERFLEATMKNLQQQGFPQVTRDHMYFRKTSSSKEARRQKIAQAYHIVLLMGDNLNDFAAVFEKQPSLRRNALVDSLQNAFGNRFIVLPNPMYGEWEGAIYQYRWDLSPEEKAQRRKQALHSF